MATSGSKITRKRVRKSRGRGLRTRSGCIACRSRHIKCPEEKPRCRRCQIAGHECIYDDVNDALGQQGEYGAPRRDVTSLENEQNPQEDEPTSLRDGQITKATSEERVEVGPKKPVVVPTGLPMTPFPLDPDLFHLSPSSSWGIGPGYTAEAAGLGWLNLLTADALDFQSFPTVETPAALGNFPPPDLDPAATRDAPSESPEALELYVSDEEVALSQHEASLFQHFVKHLAAWTDLTDPDRSFEVVVPSMALRNAGLMKAVLALSARHLSLSCNSSLTANVRVDRTLSVRYYNETLQYLQQAMENKAYLRSDHLLATVLVISTYEMIDGSESGWERHLRGVFWIQRSQLIHGESEGIKKCIWWAWLRQDIWAAYKERRKILSYYTLQRPCSQLDFWELVNRSYFLLGQCVNYASDKETAAGISDVQGRIAKGQALWHALEEWAGYFAQHDRRLPAPHSSDTAFQPIWINPPAASTAVQVHHFAKILLLDAMPASGGLKELTSRSADVQHCVNMICGIALFTDNAAAAITSTQCLLAALNYVQAADQKQAIDEMLRSHHQQTGWPNHDWSNEKPD